MKNKETLEEVATKEGFFRASQHNFNQAEAGYNAKWFKRGALFGAKYQQEQDKKLYSEVLEKVNAIIKNIEGYPDMFQEGAKDFYRCQKVLLEQFKKK